MISTRTSSIPKEDVFPKLVYSDSRWAQTCRRRSEGYHRGSHSGHRRSQTCGRCSQTCRQCSPTCRRHCQVLLGAHRVLSNAPKWSPTHHNHSHVTPRQVIKDLTDSEGQPECHPTVWYSPVIDTSNLTLHILSDTSGGSQRLNYILLMTYTWQYYIWWM